MPLRFAFWRVRAFLAAAFLHRTSNNCMVIMPLEIPFIHLVEKHSAFVNRLIPKRDFQLPPDVAEVVRHALPVIPTKDDVPPVLVSLN
jgi:hypothetical protein